MLIPRYYNLISNVIAFNIIILISSPPKLYWYTMILNNSYTQYSIIITIVYQ